MSLCRKTFEIIIMSFARREQYGLAEEQYVTAVGHFKRVYIHSRGQAKVVLPAYFPGHICHILEEVYLAITACQ